MVDGAGANWAKGIDTCCFGARMLEIRIFECSSVYGYLFKQDRNVVQYNKGRRSKPVVRASRRRVSVGWGQKRSGHSNPNTQGIGAG